EMSRLVGGRKVIIASNRGPVEFYRDARGKLTTKRGAGGVVTALAALAVSLPLTWIAAAMSAGDHEAFVQSDGTAGAARAGPLGRPPPRGAHVRLFPRPPPPHLRH